MLKACLTWPAHLMKFVVKLKTVIYTQIMLSINGNLPMYAG